MVAFKWVTNDTMEELLVGVTEDPIATIFRSKKGLRWKAHIELPIKNNLWKRWLPKDELKSLVEKLVDRWITYATMDPPAEDRNSE